MTYRNHIRGHFPVIRILIRFFFISYRNHIRGYLPVIRILFITYRNHIRGRLPRIPASTPPFPCCCFFCRFGPGGDGRQSNGAPGNVLLFELESNVLLFKKFFSVARRIQTLLIQQGLIQFLHDISG